MTTAYWTRMLQHRLGRRRGLAAAGATALGASLLAACGGGGKEKLDLGLASEPVDTTRQAVRGGVMQSFLTTDAPHFDPLSGTAAIQAHANRAYSRLFTSKLGTYWQAADGSVEPDAAAAYEISTDGLQYTLRLRDSMKFDQRPPTNGRTLNSQDVKYSWDKFTTLNPARSEWLASIVPDAPVDRLEYPDARTVVVKLASPYGGILRKFTGPTGLTLYIVPVEADGGFDTRQEMRGSGPWILTRYEPSVRWEYRRNPNWYRAAERPFLDGVDFALMTEEAVRLSQFRAKHIWHYTPAGEHVADIVRQSPGALVVPMHPLGTGASGGFTLALSKLETSPLQKDVRIRQAISLLIDRDAWIDTFFNVSGLEREGLPMQAAWNSHIVCTAPEWLDPKTNKLGPDSKWFHHNPEEAARLLRAAGAFGLEQEFSYATSGFTTPTTTRQMEVFAQMLQEGGHFKLKVNTGDYTVWYQPTYIRGRAQWEGIAWTPGNHDAIPDVDSALWMFYAPNARNDGIYSWDRVPGLEDLMVRHRRERDDSKRVAITHELQRFLAKHMPAIKFPGVASTFHLYWPWMGNAGVYRLLGSNAAVADDTLLHIWYDKSKHVV